jgi:hypothetical protein
MLDVAEAGNNKPFDPKLLIQKYETIERMKDKMIKRGMRVITVSGDKAPATIVGLLQQLGQDSAASMSRYGPESGLGLTE